MNPLHKSEVALLKKGLHYDPHRILGVHGKEIRIWRPGALQISLEVLGKIVEATPSGKDGLFVYLASKTLSPADYRIYHQNGTLAYDPYAFSPTVGEMDLFLFNKGCHYELYNVLGSSFKRIQGVEGVQFAVWAPNAERISLVADFNYFDGRLYPMRSLGSSGIWEIFVPGIQEGEKYKFEVRTKDGALFLKSDPYAFYAELRPNTASVVASVDRFAWEDQAWMQKRKSQTLQRPFQVYEVHLGSWKRDGEKFLNYRTLARELGAYCKQMGFTHVELLPIMEHPLDESWGYQVSGFYAVTSRFGSVLDFQYFVNALHQMGIGVILDWVPAHFPKDDFALHRFDGTALYEHEDPRKGSHPHWQTAIFNYGRREVCNFLIASALFWLEKMHVDGIRVDAVASMLYLDYGREKGEWIPNPDGSNYNLEAIEFLKHMNSIVHKRVPGALMIAEESSSYHGVTHPEGLGFDLKWNMGWMNDTLRYVQRDPIYRKHHQNELSFSLLYAFSEQFISVLSHDEVVHGKGSLLSKMAGTDWQKFAGLRLLYSYMMGHPGKKLLFMGGEFGQWAEWNASQSLDWHLLQYLPHQGIQKMVADLNHLALRYPPFWKQDFSWDGYEWVDFSDAGHSVIAYLRKAEGSLSILFVHHFSPSFEEAYSVPLRNAKKVLEIFNTDAEKYGGSNQLNPEIKIHETHIVIRLAPLATMIFEIK